uniref:transposase n=1 Tax=Candidatus Cloacimonas acidaminovorans TaxID=456827 RepID=UPI002A4E1AF9|nr:transposase [Candidatus Cloacimonas acidaminovorans]
MRKQRINGFVLMGKTLTLDNEEVVRANGPERTVKSYRCEDCQDCPFVQKCIPYKNKSGKNLVYDPYLSPLRQETVHNLQSKEGKKLMKKRCIEPEAVFASIKWNSKFSRFTVRSLSKCKNQLLLVLLGHNIQKFYNASMATMTGT